ncbi:MAG: hypothetical protein AAFX99_07520 [Myxococcota bacterium]
MATIRYLSPLLIAIVLMHGAACSNASDESPEADASESGTEVTAQDSGFADAMLDTASPDTEPPDTAFSDTAPSDADLTDATSSDSGLLDTALPDTVPSDTDMTDTAPLDTDEPDTTPSDMDVSADTAPLDLTSNPYVICEFDERPRADLVACNGDPSLCARRYNEVAYATTHNGMSSHNDGWIAANHCFGITTQLEEGIQALMLDTHYDNGQVSLCHGPCGFGRQPIVEGLAEIERFLRANPGQVVTIIFEDYTDPEDIRTAFAQANLLDLVHTQPEGEPWPTLQEMLDAERRLVVFTDTRSNIGWYHYVWDYAWETHFSNQSAADMTCNPNRGNPNHALFILNHFLTNLVPSPLLADEVNHNPFFLDRARACERDAEQLPNFITVDFYTWGDLMEVVRVLNGLAE